MKNIENIQVPIELIPDKVFVGLFGDWYYGWKGWAGEPIKKFGLQPGKVGQFKHTQNGKRKDSVYVSTELVIAETYARINNRPMVLEIDVTKLNKKQFYYDPLDIESLANPIQMAYRGTIPVSAIKIKEAI